jgi:hypothetical protein
MSKTAACALGAAALSLVAACSSGSASTAHSTGSAVATKPAISASAACKDFEAWWITTVNGSNLQDNALLVKAVSEAPSGQLYQDMSTVRQNVDYTATLTGSLAQSSKDLVITQVDNVVTNDCGSVNPNS